MAFWVGDEDPPLWNLHPQFRWIVRGTPVRYIGCTVGIDLLAKIKWHPSY